MNKKTPDCTVHYLAEQPGDFYFKIVTKVVKK